MLTCFCVSREIEHKQPKKKRKAAVFQCLRMGNLFKDPNSRNNWESAVTDQNGVDSGFGFGWG